MNSLDETDNFLEVFKNSLEFKSGKRKFIVPVPEPRIVSQEEQSKK